MDFSKLAGTYRARSREVDPLKIFNGLTLRGTIENVWEPQAAALRLWHAKRDSADVTIEMNTGGGKTLVALLIAQSLVNEMQGSVVYVCPNIQLIEQTKARAEEVGLQVATYFDQTWSKRDQFDSGIVPCVTNYAAVFNGISIFRRESISALVFDDAHVAGDVIRDRYTLSIPSRHAAFKPLANLFRNFFLQSLREQSLDSAMQGDPFVVLYVPMFEVVRRRADLLKLLIDTKVPDRDVWAWEHVKDHLHLCCVLVTGSRIEIAPPVLPVQELSYFKAPVRRIYMTATLPLQTEFVRTFGVGAQVVLQPEGKSGEAQKLFLFVQGSDDDAQRKDAKKLLRDMKACIIAPSNNGAKQWVPPAEIYDKDSGHAGIERFAKADAPAKLAFAARFDGIDLPGKACRALVLDGLPKGTSLFRAFQDQSLAMERLKTSGTGIRVTQAIGRIFRSNTDHGAVVVIGHDLQRWLRKPEHRSLMPDLLQRQIELGFTLLEAVNNGDATYDGLLNAVMEGGPSWDTYYNTQMQLIGTAARRQSPQWLQDSVLEESKAFHLLWAGQHERAREVYRSAASNLETVDNSLHAWMLHWSGTCSQLLGDEAAAHVEFSAAANIRADLGRPRQTGAFKMRSMPMGPQSRNMAQLLSNRPNDVTQMRKHVSEWLEYGPETAKCEQALCDLGSLLGFETSRPDKSVHTGPDVLWLLNSPAVAVGLEAKTDKNKGEYRKVDEIGQVHDHLQWMKTQYPGHSLFNSILGKSFAVSKDSNPPEGLRVVPLDGVKELASRVEGLYVSISGLPPALVEERIESLLRDQGLRWPECWESLPGQLATDLQSHVGKEGA